MDRIIKEELMRSIAVFFFAFVGSGIVMRELGVHSRSLFILLGIPLVITAAVFSALVYKRKNTDRDFKVKPGSVGWKLSMGLLAIGGIVLILTGVRLIPTDDMIAGILSLSLGLFCVFAGLKELRKFK